MTYVKVFLIIIINIFIYFYYDAKQYWYGAMVINLFQESML